MTEPQLVKLGTLSIGQWVRLSGGDIGLIRDKINQPSYRKSCIEVPGHRYPMRVTNLDTLVEVVPNHKP